MLNENQHNHWSNILACQIDDPLSYRRLWNGMNGDRIWACHIDFYMMFEIKFFYSCRSYIEFQLFIWLQGQQNSMLLAPWMIIGIIIGIQMISQLTHGSIWKSNNTKVKNEYDPYQMVQWVRHSPHGLSLVGHLQYMWSVYINNHKMHAMANFLPRTFRNVKCEIGNESFQMIYLWRQRVFIKIFLLKQLNPDHSYVFDWVFIPDKKYFICNRILRIVYQVLGHSSFDRCDSKASLT